MSLDLGCVLKNIFEQKELLNYSRNKFVIVC